ncbi:MAG: glutamine--fructose-6-phosphate transaminase (isomerizing) [Nanoarchaeota archaeon]|nr:glutamine--fructose-6-phosphate transaminase (isomerizing) [Nanoarchaeota archaeon]
MCGIVGYIGTRQAGPLLIEGLRKLEYRGYDSAGIATVHDGAIEIRKDIGKIEAIEKKIGLSLAVGTIGIAHCRWATHGGVTQKNAHPHVSPKHQISLVHNGIIENFSELKKKLQSQGYAFQSETDTEVVAHLVDSLYAGSLKEAVQNAVVQLEGAYSLAVISAKEPGTLVATRNESPLIIGVGKGENFVASDVPAILAHTRKVVYLKNQEVVVLTATGVELFGKDGGKLKPETHTITWDEKKAEKGGYPHFMLKEIFEQPQVVTETIEGRIGEGRVTLEAAEQLGDVKRIIIVACGTSWHSGLIGEFMLEEVAKIPVEVEYASEFRYRDPIIEPGTLVLAISQSGETADTLAAMREAKKKGARVLAIVNALGSSIAREADSVIYTKAGPEIGVASTKAFVGQVIVLYLLTMFLGRKNGLLDEQQVRNRVRDLRLLPLQMQQILDEHDSVKTLAKKFAKKRNALYLGRGINYPIALEGALKLKEVSYVHAEGYPAAEMKHGPIALVDKEMPVVVVVTKDDRTYKKVLSNIQEVKARGGHIIAIASKGDTEIKRLANEVIYVPRNSYLLNPLLAVLPLQLLSYYAATARGFDPDKPKNLAKSVTVE